MPKLSLTDFVDIASKAGLPKATKLKNVKHRGPYEPQTDFYRRLRETIVEAHSANAGKKLLKNLPIQLTDTKKKNNYPIAIAGYLKWWGNKKFAWFVPPYSDWSAGTLTVRVNPELGLVVKGQPLVVKLYLKSDPVPANRVGIVCHLMEGQLGTLAPKGTQFAVLDVRRGRLATATQPPPLLAGLVAAEAAWISAMWPMV